MPFLDHELVELAGRIPPELQARRRRQGRAQAGQPRRGARRGDRPDQGLLPGPGHPAARGAVPGPGAGGADRPGRAPPRAVPPGGRTRSAAPTRTPPGPPWARTRSGSWRCWRCGCRRMTSAEVIGGRPASRRWWPPGAAGARRCPRTAARWPSSATAAGCRSSGCRICRPPGRTPAPATMIPLTDDPVAGGHLVGRRRLARRRRGHRRRGADAGVGGPAGRSGRPAAGRRAGPARRAGPVDPQRAPRRGHHPGRPELDEPTRCLPVRPGDRRAAPAGDRRADQRAGPVGRRELRDRQGRTAGAAVLCRGGPGRRRGPPAAPLPRPRLDGAGDHPAGARRERTGGLPGHRRRPAPPPAGRHPARSGRLAGRLGRPGAARGRRAGGSGRRRRRPPAAAGLEHRGRRQRGRRCWTPGPAPRVRRRTWAAW